MSTTRHIGYPDEEPEVEDQPSDWSYLAPQMAAHCGFCGVTGHVKKECPVKAELSGSCGKPRTRRSVKEANK